jgi:DNA-binding NarL/FixJ family response regulator
MLTLMQELADRPPPLPGTQARARQPSLSPRESQIVQHMLLNEKERTIAFRLDISVHTVHTHIKRIYWKLGVNSRVELVSRILGEFAEWSRQQRAPNETAIPFALRRAA